jgi:parallel beta-helix repeat protein
MKNDASIRFFCLAAFWAWAQTAGALDLDVPLGGDIQQAIDQVAAAGGGTVQLAAGIYPIHTSIKMKSDVTLSGAGRTATTITTPEIIRLIEQASEGLQHVTIRDLSLTGVAVDGSHAIHLVSYKTEHKNIQLSRVHASRTGWGVHIKGADGVRIEQCEFTENGCQGKEGYAHNLYLRRCKNVWVCDTQLNRSTSGNGCNISYSQNVTLDRCEACDNYFRGIRAADTDGYAVKNCTISGNGDVGLLANKEKVATKNILFENNIVTKNAKGGIQARKGVTGIVTGCTAFHNTPFDFDLNPDIQQRGILPKVGKRKPERSNARTPDDPLKITDGSLCAGVPVYIAPSPD